MEHIHANEVVLVFGYSRTVLHFLRRAAEKRNFEVGGRATMLAGLGWGWGGGSSLHTADLEAGGWVGCGVWLVGLPLHCAAADAASAVASQASSRRRAMRQA